jgi:hypothetical protein
MSALLALCNVHRCRGSQQQEVPDSLTLAAREISASAFESASEDIDISPILDDLRELEENPLDIAQVTAAELQQIPGVSAQAAFRIVSYRDRHSLSSCEDLRNVQGIDPELIDALKAYITFTGSSSRSETYSALRLRSRVVRRISQAAAVGTDQFLGSPDKVSNRIAGRINLSSESHSSNRNVEGLSGASLSFGVLTSKDPGEQSYADLLRGQLMMNLPAYSTRIILGDFLVDGGQGLVFWRQTGFSKGGEATSGVARNGRGVWPSLSTGASMTFRGVGLNVQPKGFGIHLFYSNKLLDATSDSEGIITHLSSDDLHRTESELSSRERLREKTFGGRLTVDPGRGLRLGVSGFISRFDESVELPGAFGFRGTQTSALGFDGMYTDGSVSAFAELAHASGGAPAVVAGCSAYLRADLSVAFLYRSYPRDYNNFHCSGFSESGNGNKSESGFYTGISWRPTPWLRMNAFIDQFSFPWRTFGELMTSDGHEYFLSADAKVSDNLCIEVQFRQKDKTEPKAPLEVANEAQSVLESRGRNSYRSTLRFEPVRWLRWQNSIELVTVGLEHQPEQERGMLFFQDVTADFERVLFLSFRIVAFHTDSYVSRVFEYEAELPGAYSNPPLSDSGIRWYLLGRYRCGGNLDFTMKYSQTSKSKSSKGAGGVDSQLSVQLDLIL